MISREQIIESLKERLVDRAKRGRDISISSVLAFSTGYMPDLTLEEFDGILEYMKEKFDIIF